MAGAHAGPVIPNGTIVPPVNVLWLVARQLRG
jgi:hypothetical protein